MQPNASEAPVATTQKRDRFAESLRIPARPSSRTAVGRHVKAYRASWAARLGGALTREQTALLDLCCQLKCRLVAMDQKHKAAGYELTGHDDRSYLAWHNSLARREAELRGMIPRNGNGGSTIAALNALVDDDG